MNKHSTLVYFLLIIFVVNPNPIDRHYCLKQGPELVDCQWYLECLERLFQCGNKGYPINYGHKYCSKFKEADFPEIAIPWINKTMICLKKALVPIMERRLAGKAISCHQLKQEAYTSHPICYTQSGFCGLLRHKTFKQAAQIIHAFWTIFDLSSIIGYDADKQIYEVFKICLFG